MVERGTVKGQLLRTLDEAFRRDGWHGPTLKGALRGVDAAAAAWHPAAGRHSIRDLAVHAAYWKHVVVGRITGEARPRFGLPGTNWFEPSARLTAAQWRDDLARLSRVHERLVRVVTALPEAALTGRTPAGRETVDRAVSGRAPPPI
jgi:hypothetical protein